MIEASHLTKRYAGGGGVEDLSLNVRPGEVVGLLGLNGAGKTTALRLLTGALPTEGGTVRLGGIDLDSDPRGAKARLGYLPEAPVLWPELTVRQTLRFGASLRRLLASAADEVLERLRLQPLAERAVGVLSKGQRQKVALAWSLLGSPPAVVLDEPTDGLDPAERAEVHALVRSLASSAVLLSSHLLPEVRAVCTRALVVQRGRMAAELGLSDDAGRAELERVFFAHAD